MRISDWSSDVCSSDLVAASDALRSEEISHDVQEFVLALEGCEVAAVGQFLPILDVTIVFLNQRARPAERLASEPCDAGRYVHPRMAILAADIIFVNEAKADRKSDELGKRVSVSVIFGGGRIIKKKQKTNIQ